MMKMNNKGFTLVEIIAVIAILGILMILVASTANNTLTNARARSYDALMEQIADAAESYAVTSGVRAFYIRELIEEGYIEAENDGILRSPIDNSSLNCYEVHLDFIRGTWVLNRIDEATTQNCPARPVPDRFITVTGGANRNVTVTCRANEHVIVTTNHGFYSHGICQGTSLNVNNVPIGTAAQRPTIISATRRNNENDIFVSSYLIN